MIISSRRSWRLPLGIVLLGGLVLRLVLAFVILPGRGYAPDLDDFGSWAVALGAHGPGDFYRSAPGANYPPLYMYVLWGLDAAAHPLARIVGTTSTHMLVDLLKLPAVIADVLTAALVAKLAADWRGPKAGVVAAGIYLLLPPTWYDSAVWGQVDAVDTLFMLAALVALLAEWSEPAVALAVAGVLVKPQAIVGLIVVLAVLAPRHTWRRASGATMDGPLRLFTSAVVGLFVVVATILPFDLGVFDHGPTRHVAVLDKVIGLADLLRRVSGQFDVVTANAYNGWAFAGSHPLATTIGRGRVVWYADSLRVLGVPAVDIGTAALLLTAVVVVVGLALRPGRAPVIVGYTLLALAFYFEPTRVHERYLVPAFAGGAVLAAVGLAAALATLAVGVANAANLHAVLAAPLQLFEAGPASAFSGLHSTRNSFAAARGVELPLAGLVRNQGVVTAVVVIQGAALVALLVIWCRPGLGPLGGSGATPRARGRPFWLRP